MLLRRLLSSREKVPRSALEAGEQQDAAEAFEILVGAVHDELKQAFLNRPKLLGSISDLLLPAGAESSK